MAKRLATTVRARRGTSGDVGSRGWQRRTISRGGRVALLAAMLWVGAAAPGVAQTGPQEAAAEASLKFGGLALTPVVSLNQAGYDSNVFYVTPSQADFTATVSPQVDLWLRMGRSWLSGAVKEDLVYFHEFSSERSVNGSYAASWFMPFNRVAFTLDGSYLNTRERQGFDIDARSRRLESAFGGAVSIRAAPTTSVNLVGRRRRIDFDEAEVYEGSNLSEELSRTSVTAGVALRRALTPLTTVSIEVSRDRDRFDFSPLRDSDSTRVMAGAQFGAFALISGSASFGYRRFTPLSPGVEGFDGLNWAADLTYTALVWTKLSVQATRDLQYSYDASQPYYVQTGVTGAFGQQIRGPVGMTARAGLQHLDYQAVAGADPAQNTADDVRTIGAGLEYRLDEEVQMFFNVDRQARTSGDASREYSGFRCTATVTYRF